MGDIGINLLSDTIFVGLIAVIVGLASICVRYLRIGRAESFFGLAERPVSIYVSGLYYANVVTHRVVNAIEYDAAVHVREKLTSARTGGVVWSLVAFLARLIGHEVNPGEIATIRVAPLAATMSGPQDPSVICIGGPLSNMFSQYYLRSSIRFRFNQAIGVYEENVNATYVRLEPAHDVALLEKISINGQTVFVAHGTGEEQSQRAANYLMLNWEKLLSEHQRSDFAIRV